MPEGAEIRPARAGEVEELLPLMRAYCDFYASSPSDAGLREMARALISDPEQGALFVARRGEMIGFAAMGWKWSSTRGARIGVLEDLFVTPEARGQGFAEALIEACAGRCRERGAPVLEWYTAPDNDRAQAVYDRVGGTAETWIQYELET
jgi:ribosomal protein S18 acetylase RimI-like enzyme